MSILFIIQIITVVMMIGVILMQKTSSDGLMSGSNPDSFLTGRASANILSRTTAILAAIFIINSLVMGYIASHTKRVDNVVDEAFSQNTEESGKTEAEGNSDTSTKAQVPAADVDAKPSEKATEAPVENAAEKPAEKSGAKPATVPNAD